MRFLELVALLEQLPLDPDGYQCVPRPLDARLKHTRWRGSDRRNTVARAEYSLLAALALSGWAMRQALLEAVTWDKALGRPRAAKLDGVYEDAANHLTEAGLWESATEALAGAGQGSGQAPRRPGSRAVIVRLTEQGRQALAQIRLQPVEDEWTRIERLHGGARDGGQMAHTAAICTFTHHARRRGYDTQVCPDMKGVAPVGTSLGLEIPAHPDVALTDPVGKMLYVEVQRGDSGTAQKRAVKWRNLFWLQGVVAICAATPAQARRYAEEARAAKASHGLVTDVRSLRAGHPTLWTHEWFGQEPLEPYRSEDVSD